MMSSSFRADRCSNNSQVAANQLTDRAQQAGDPNSGIARRDFLAQGCVASTAGVIGLSSTASGSWFDDKQVGKKTSLLQLDANDFKKLIGHTFMVDGTAHSATQHQAALVLTEVTPRNHASDKDRPANLRRSGFSLVFTAKNGEELEDGTHRVVHRRLKPTELFLHEILREKDPHHKHYEIIFN